MKKFDKKIVIISIFVLFILIIVLTPKVAVLNDGGTKIYKSIIYEVTKAHKIREGGYLVEGTIVKVFGKQIYCDIPKDVKIIEDGKEKNEVSTTYEKNIDDVTLKLEIPNDWKYEELSQNTENDFYKYALKIYKTQEDKYAVLYFYHQMFGVCGTGRTSEQIELNNGIKATIGYYYEKDIWEDISFYETNKNIAIINYGLDKAEAEEVIDFVKTINIMENSNKKENMEWNEITQNGVNEELLLKNLDTDILKEVASNLQSAMDEELKEERENPEIVITEGWTRIFKKEGYKKVIDIGTPAIKPLYYILYKSPNNGEYEYICAMALQTISGIKFDEENGSLGWITAKEYLDLFTKKVSSKK